MIEGTQLVRHCLSLKAAVQERPFGPQLLAFKVGGKIFALFHEGEGHVSFKASEIAYEILREQERARRAPYLPRGGWLNAPLSGDWAEGELQDLITQSHALVSAGLTRKQRAELGL